MGKKVRQTAEQLIEDEFPATGNETPLTQVQSSIGAYGTSPSEDTPSSADQILSSANSNPFQAQKPILNQYSDLLSNFTGSQGPQLSVRDILTPQNDYEKQVMGDADRYAGAIGPQAASTYFPGATQNIQQGYYSGSMIGSNPIYAPSGLYPYGLIDARQKALKDAADKKAAELEAFKNKIQGAKAPVTKHKAVQPQITEAFYTGLNDWIDKSKKDNPNADPYKSLWANPDFHKWMQNLNDVAGYEDQAVEHVAEIEKASEKGDYALTPAIVKKLDEFKTGKHGLLTASMNPEDNQEALKIFNLGPIKDAAKMAKATADGIDSDVFEGAAKVSPQGLYDILTSTKVTKPNEQRIKDAVDQSWKFLYGGREDLVGLSKDEYYKLVAANFGKKTETTTQTVSTKDGNGYDFQMDETGLSQAPVSIASQTDGKGGVGAYSLSSSYNIPANMQKPFEMAIPSNAKDVSGNIISGKTTGNVTATVSQVGNAVIVHKKGSSADGKAIDFSNPETVQHYKDAGFTFTVIPQAVVTVEGYDDKGKKSPGQNSTIAVDLDHLRNNVMKTDEKGQYKTGVNVPLLEQKAKELQENLSGSKKYSAAQEAFIKKNMDANPSYSREEIIQALKL